MYCLVIAEATVIYSLMSLIKCRMTILKLVILSITNLSLFFSNLAFTVHQ